jgi:hypothetical protein
MATNDLSALNTKLVTALRDTTYATWGTGEIDDLLIWAAAMLYPRVARRVQEEEEMLDDEHEYGFAALEIDRVDVIDRDTNKVFRILTGGTWEYFADPLGEGGNLYINPRFNEPGKNLRVHGWGRYDLSENIPPDDVVPLILAVARAEACRREVSRRYASTNWQTLDQRQNISVNELVQMVNEADTEAERLSRKFQTMRRPKPARVG